MFYIKICFFGRNRSRGKMVRLRNTATLFYSTVPLLFSTVYQYLVRFFTRLDHPFSVYCHCGLVNSIYLQEKLPRNEEDVLNTPPGCLHDDDGESLALSPIHCNPPGESPSLSGAFLNEGIAVAPGVASTTSSFGQEGEARGTMLREGAVSDNEQAARAMDSRY